jgi:hypothetical protein
VRSWEASVATFSKVAVLDPTFSEHAEALRPAGRRIEGVATYTGAMGAELAMMASQNTSRVRLCAAIYGVSAIIKFLHVVARLLRSVRKLSSFEKYFRM